MDAAVSTPPLRIALVGVPNCGKTALFNRLTGSRQKVANYPGVTVERREGERAARRRPQRCACSTCPAPTASSPTTLDEAITRDVLLGRVADAPAPELVVCVVDAVHLPIGLRLALEVKRLGLPMVLALNRMDVAQPPRRAHRRRAAVRRARRAGAADRRRETRRRRRAHRGHRAGALGAASQRCRAGMARDHAPKTPSRRRRDLRGLLARRGLQPRRAKAAGSARIDARAAASGGRPRWCCSP